jgi:hypothetical protein
VKEAILLDSCQDVLKALVEVLFSVIVFVRMSDPHNAVRLSALKSIQNEEYGKAVMSFLSLLTSRCPISKIENDLVYAMDLYVASLCQLNQHSKSRWLWAKTIEFYYTLMQDFSVLLES